MKSEAMGAELFKWFEGAAKGENHCYKSSCPWNWREKTRIHIAQGHIPHTLAHIHADQVQFFQMQFYISWIWDELKRGTQYSCTLRSEDAEIILDLPTYGNR